MNAVSEDEPAPASANSVVEDSPEKWQNAEDQAAASEALKESTNMDSDLEYEDAEPQLDNEASPVVSERPQSDFVSYSVDASGDLNKFKWCTSPGCERWKRRGACSCICKQCGSG